MIKLKKEIFSFLLGATILTGCAGDQETEMFFTPKLSAVVNGNDVLIDQNGQLIVARGEAQTYKQLLQRNGEFLAVVRVQDISGGIRYILQ